MQRSQSKADLFRLSSSFLNFRSLNKGILGKIKDPLNFGGDTASVRRKGEVFGGVLATTTLNTKLIKS